jgi:hypothetical protein
MKNWLLAFLLPFVGIFAQDHLVNINMTLGHPKMKEISSFELDYRLVHTVANTSIVLNPRFKPIGNGNLYSGISVGARTQQKFGMFGYHVGCDHSYIHKSNHLQMVPSFEYFYKNINYHFNAYMPIKNFQENQTIGKLIEAHPYFDHEIVYKWPILNSSFSHNFDMTTKSHGYVGKVSKDIGPINVILSGGLDGHHGKHVQLSLSYILPYATSRDAHSRINRRLGTVYSCKVLKEPKPNEQLSTLTIKTIDNATQDQINQIRKLIDEGAVPAPIPPKKTGWDKFCEDVLGRK